jgi:hypothetical protein
MSEWLEWASLYWMEIVGFLIVTSPILAAVIFCLYLAIETHCHRQQPFKMRPGEYAAFNRQRMEKK